MLRVQDLTKGDNKRYAKAELKSHRRWRKLREKEPNEAPKLIHDISAKSSGVFLWVYLVIRSLKDGLRNGDSISDLQRRVDSFPSDLEDYFMHILGRLEPFYFQQAKKFFRVYRKRSSSSANNLLFPGRERSRIRPEEPNGALYRRRDC
ncbi:hypothetical protein MMC18_007972, partial [Xylographa bjoerkii]|nr:hypothetical protein [Xylographa bjoerkii]